jgi:hypothetical protein
MAKKTTTHKPPKLPPAIIIAAITGFESQKTRIDAEIATLRAMLEGGTKPTATATPETAMIKRRKFSAAARRRMKEAQQRRWAKIKGESEPPAPAAAEPSKPKRKLSKEGRAAIVAALKKRWREKKVAAKTKPALAKKAAVKKAAPVKAAKKTAAKKGPVKVAAKAPE